MLAASESCMWQAALGISLLTTFKFTCTFYQYQFSGHEKLAYTHSRIFSRCSGEDVF
jgi:hypothetical protein